MTDRRKYDFDRLDKYCKENNVILLEDYSNIKLNQKSRIIGNCLSINCVNYFNKSFENFYKRSGYCDLCTKNIKVNKQKETFLKNYGVDNPNKLEEIRDKIYNTNFKIYGFKYSFCSQDVKDKIKNTMINIYGVENPTQNNIIKEKIKNTCLIKYGSKTPSGNNEIKNKMKNTMLEKYGVEYASQNKEIREKIIKTNIKKWGVENPTQNSEIAEKASNNSYQTKIYTFPSGNTIKYQGYENYALDELIDLKIDENDIINKRTDVPEIWFYYNDKKSRHYVDIYIKSQNKCIEVKSEWYFNKDKNKIIEKQKSGKDLGYNYEIWVYDKKGNKTCYP